MNIIGKLTTLYRGKFVFELSPLLLQQGVILFGDKIPEANQKNAVADEQLTGLSADVFDWLALFEQRVQHAEKANEGGGATAKVLLNDGRRLAGRREIRTGRDERGEEWCSYPDVV